MVSHITGIEDFSVAEAVDIKLLTLSCQEAAILAVQLGSLGLRLAEYSVFPREAWYQIHQSS